MIEKYNWEDMQRAVEDENERCAKLIEEVLTNIDDSHIRMLLNRCVKQIRKE